MNSGPSISLCGVFLREEVVGRRLAAFFAVGYQLLFGGELGRRVLGWVGAGDDQLLVPSSWSSCGRPLPILCRLRAVGPFGGSLPGCPPIAVSRPIRFGSQSKKKRRAGLVAHSVALPTLVAPGMPTWIWSFADPRDFDLRDAELVAAGADDVDALFHRRAVDRRLLRGRPALQDELHAALEVKAELASACLAMTSAETTIRPKTKSRTKRCRRLFPIAVQPSGVRTISSPPSSS